MTTDAASKVRGRLVNGSELAEILGANAMTVRGWTDKKMPYVSRGGRGREWKFDTAEVVDWLIDRARGGSTAADINESKRRKAAADANMAELEVECEVMPVAWMQEIIGAQFEVLRSRLWGLPGRAAPLVTNVTDTKKNHATLKKLISEAIDEMRGVTSEDIEAVRRKAN